MRACELAGLLARDAEGVARHLLPEGRRQGREWIIGDLDGGAGESLKVHLEGGKAGVWKDFATDEGGDLIGLWMATRQVDLRTACTEAAEYLGVVEKKLAPNPKLWSLPTRKGLSRLKGQAEDWLTGTRKIPAESIAAYKVAQTSTEVMFPSLVGGELIAAKYRKLSDKKFRVDANCQPVLFGWQAIKPEARTVAICEGEVDALSLHAYGIPALSVPFGGGGGDKQAWIANEFDRLAVYDTIYLCLDVDDVGLQGTKEIARRLGLERCAVVKLPRKDANQCLMDGVGAEEIAKCFADARTMDPERLKSIVDFIEDTANEFIILEKGEVGIRLPWQKVKDNLLLRPGETSLWFGINGHGKSMVAQHILLGAMADGHRCCAANLEFLPQKWLRRVMRQAMADPFPNLADLKALMAAQQDTLWLYSCAGSTHLDDILEVFAYASRRYGIELFQIDNFAKLSIAEDDYQGQKVFMDRITDFARDYNVHVMVVAHTRKTQNGENTPPEKGDLKGSGALSDLADTVVAVWRNKPKERDMANGTGRPGIEADPDCLLVAHKQRNGEVEPTVHLWFDHRTQQYLERREHTPVPILYLPEVA